MALIQAAAGCGGPGRLGEVRLVIRGHDLPGASYDGHARIAVGLQVRDEPAGVVPGDAASARWETDVRLVDGDARGPAVHGRRGDRFVYLTWGAVPDESFEGFAMFRRAKLMLDRVDPALVTEAEESGRPLVADVGLTDEKGGPRCARVDPPAIVWSVGET
jgi:Family of unknown function (DUF5990)